MPNPKILALCGSLRSASINRSLLQAVTEVSRELSAPFELNVFSAMGELPLFNPDLESNLPAAVQILHAAIAEAEMLVIASPEYAHGVTGVMKNALDWCVSLEAFVNKPVLVLLARARSQFADAALHEILRTMSAQIVNDASLVLDLQSDSFTTATMLSSARVRPQLEKAVRLMETTLQAGRSDM